MRTLPTPKAGLLNHNLDSQTLVYDPEADKVHLLDQTSSLVLDFIMSGGSDPGECIARISRELGLTAGDELLDLAVDELQRAGLLADSAALVDTSAQGTRRDLVRKLAAAGIAAMMVPAIATFTATKGYAQASQINIGQGGACAGDGNCGAGLVCNDAANFVNANGQGTCQPC